MTKHSSRLVGLGVICLAGLAYGAPAMALDILLTNDDGFETANTRALYQALKDDGNQVIIAAPANQQSGTGAALTFGTLPALSQDSRYGTVKAGAPAVGAAPGDGHIYYVNGSPVTAVLYGIDVLAPQVFGQKPDLVISGPNIGHNLGPIVVSSGTVGATLYATRRGLPAIAVSYDSSPENSFQHLSNDSIESHEAQVVLRLVHSLEKAQIGDRLLPEGVGLSVNVPHFDGDTNASDLAFVLTSISCIGSRDDYFIPSGDNAANRSDGPRLGYGTVDDPDAKKLGVDFNCPQQTTPQGVPPSEAVQLAQGKVTISPIQATVQASRSQRQAAQVRLRDLLGAGQ